MFPLFRQTPLTDEKITEYEQPILPAFAVYFYALSFLVAMFSSVSLEGPLLIGFALLPRLNRGANTVLSSVAVLAFTFLARAVAAVLGVVKTAGLLIANWPVMERAVADSHLYHGAGPVFINMILGAGTIMASIFILENADAATRGFLRELAAARKI